MVLCGLLRYAGCHPLDRPGTLLLQTFDKCGVGESTMGRR